MPSLREWLDEHWERESLLWIKRVEASDTLAFEEENPGPKIPFDIIPEVFPGLENVQEAGPDYSFLVRVESSDDETEVVATVSMRKRTRRDDGSRVLVPDWGDTTNPLLDPENTGSAAIFAFQPPSANGLPTCDVWVCANLDQEGIVESDWGPINPGWEIIWSHSNGRTRRYLP